MQAVRFHEYGDSSVLVLEEVPDPEPGPGQVLVRVSAAGVNPADVALRSGRMQALFQVDLPHIPCVDVTGTVAALGQDVDGPAVGTPVAAYLPLVAQGAAAEYAVAPAELVAEVPDGVDLVAAAALGGAALTAWQALFEHAGVESGQRVLVNGGGGAVGGYLVQLAHGAGIEVTATASPRSADRVRGYGADRIVDHTQTPVTSAVSRGFDAVFNFVPTTPEQSDALADLVADGGVYVTGTTPVSTDPGRGVRAVRMASRSDGPRLAQLLAQVADGSLELHPADRRPLSELGDVHAAADRGEDLGKVVVVP